MSFDNIPTNSGSNANTFTTNYSPAMNDTMGANGMDSGAGSANSSMTPNAPIKRKKLPLKMIASVIFLVMLVVGGGAGYYLTQVNQDVRNQAAGGTYGTGAPCTRDDECSGVMVCRTDVTSPTQPRCLPPIVATPAPTPIPGNQLPECGVPGSKIPTTGCKTVKK